MKRSLYIVLLLLIFVVTSFSPYIVYAEDVAEDSMSLPDSRDKWVWGKIKDFDKYVDDGLFSHKQMSENINEISLSTEIKNTKLNLLSIIIAVLSALATAGVFLWQCWINRNINRDNKKERFENRLFMYLDVYHKNIGSMLINDVCNGRVSFNFIFYEYEMVLKEFIKLKPKAKSGDRLLSYEELSSVAVSFIVNGLTRNADGSERDILYYKYRELFSIEEYERLKERYIWLEDMTDEKLCALRDAKEYTFIQNFCSLQLVDKKRVPWFWGIRANFIPYVKAVRSIVDFINKECPTDMANVYRYLESSLSEHELAVLYIFASSKENDYIGLDVESIKKIVETTNLPTLYRYDKWDDLKKMLNDSF